MLSDSWSISHEEPDHLPPGEGQPAPGLPAEAKHPGGAPGGGCGDGLLHEGSSREETALLLEQRGKMKSFTKDGESQGPHDTI